MMMRQISFLLLALVLILFSTSALAQIPRVINYQGRLLGSNEQPVAEGEYKITVRLYEEASTLLWTEIHEKTLVAGGLFHVLLGTVTPLDLPFNKPYLLGIQVGNDPELQPRMYLTSAAYSFNADRVGGISASPAPAPGVLFPLGDDAKFPPDVLPSGVAGNFLKKNRPDTTTGSSPSAMLQVVNTGAGHGVVGESSAGDKSGVYGFNANGRGITGRSDHDFGVVGWTGAESSDKGGVLGHSQSGSGVRGHSEASNGVVGWTNNSNSSGVFGFSDSGTGVAGRSGGNDGLLGVTTSGESGHAGLRARNEGGGPAIFCEGDLYITGAIRGNLGPKGEGAAFPRPAYDSGWFPIEANGQKVLNHGVGGNTDNYVVDLQFTSPAYGAGIPSVYLNDKSGTWWELTGQSITVVRLNQDPVPGQARLRIWVYK